MNLQLPGRLLLLLLLPAPGFGQQQPAPNPARVTLHFSAMDEVSFDLQSGRVTALDFHVGGMDHRVPLDCAAGGLDAVDYGSARITYTDVRDNEFTFMFELGVDTDRLDGHLPRVQVSFRRGRLTGLDRSWVTRTGTSSYTGHSEQLCAALPPTPLTCEDTRWLQGLAPAELVEQLRGLPPQLEYSLGGQEPESMHQRGWIHEELLAWGTGAVPMLAAALRDPDPLHRRNVLLAFQALTSGTWPFECGKATVDVSTALPALESALVDSDATVRAWTLIVLGDAGALAGMLPAVTGLLQHDPDEGVRNVAASELEQLGQAAASALPALRAALEDPSAQVRESARRAVERLEAGGSQ